MFAIIVGIAVLLPKIKWWKIWGFLLLETFRTSTGWVDVPVCPKYKV